MTYFSSALVTSSSAHAGLENNAIIAYENRLESVPYTVSSSSPIYPASNLANKSTAFFWMAGTTGTVTISITNGSQPLDYMGIARHNLNQLGKSLEVKFDGITIFGPAIPTENQAILFTFDEASPSTITIEISGGTGMALIGYLALGNAIRLQHGIYVGHTPIKFGRDRKTVNGLSENGQYLGELVVRETNKTSVSLQNLTPDWYRSTLDPFFASRPPCFFAWRPEKYKDEVSFCWIEGEPKVSNQRSNGMMQSSFSLRGIV